MASHEKKGACKVNLYSNQIQALYFRMIIETYIFFPASIYLFKANITNTRKWCEICSKLTIKTPERRYYQRYYFTG